MSTKYKAVAIPTAGIVEILERQLPALAPTQLVVRVQEVGLCSGEVAKFTGVSAPASHGWIGHEMVGKVEAIGSAVTGFTVGDRVVGWTPNGDAMAEKVVVEQKHMFRVGENVASAVHAEPLMCCVGTRRLIERHGDLAGKDVVIVGPGYMNLITMALVLRKQPRTVTAIARKQATLDRALRLGATDAIVAADDVDLPQALIERIGNLADVVIESTGTQAGLDSVWRLVKHEGVVAIQGFHESGDGKRTIPLDYINWTGAQIVNAHFRLEDETVLPAFEEGVELMNNQGLDLTDLVTHRFAMRDIRRAFEAATSRGDGSYVKAVITFE